MFDSLAQTRRIGLAPTSTRLPQIWSKADGTRFADSSPNAPSFYRPSRLTPGRSGPLPFGDDNIVRHFGAVHFLRGGSGRDVPTCEAGLYELDFLPWDATNLWGTSGENSSDQSENLVECYRKLRLQRASCHPAD